VYAGEQLEWLMHGTAPGSDGVWGTADDTFPSASHLRYDLGHLTGMVTSAAKGPDGMFGTADDIISLRLAFPCVGDRVVTNAYYDPGPDGVWGVWGSADDRLAGRQIESGDPCESACAPGFTTLLAEKLGCCAVLDGGTYATYAGSITCSDLGPHDPKFIDLEKYRTSSNNLDHLARTVMNPGAPVLF
jgi:hypothetical protein